MGDQKGGSSNSSGMYEAMASAQAAQQAYQLGTAQLDWTKQVWNQEQPLMDASEKQQMALAAEQQASLEQSQRESGQQYQEYESTYAPLEASYVNEAENWDSPQAIAQARGQAMADVAQQGQAGLNTAAETLRSYGINPGSGRYAGLYTGAQPMLGAAEAAAGTTAAQNLRLQKMGLESGAINTGRGLVNATEGLTSAGTGAGSAGSNSAAGAANTANTNLSTGSTAMTNPSQWFNAGANNMNTYVNAVNGYNQSENAAESGSGFGSILGTAGSLLTKALPAGFLAKGGPAVRYADGGPAIPGADLTLTPAQGGGMTGIPGVPMMPRQQYGQGGPPVDASATPGGTVPIHSSPSMGAATDDVPAMLTAHEFVIPKDVAVWKGHEYFTKQIDAARRGQQQFSDRDDIGGEPTAAIPQHPTFVSRPMHGNAMGGAIPAMPQ
jgi:hypothetical protein